MAPSSAYWERLSNSSDELSGTVSAVLALTRCSVPEPEQDEFLAAAREVLAALSARPGFRRGRVGRAMDDAAQWVLATEWDAVGAYRRGLSAYEVKLALAPVMAYIVNAPSAYEVVVTVEAEAD
jgi:heme-degrading monooxygenase HmoA